MKKQLLNYFLILLSVFILAYLWEFILEPSRPFNLITSDTESNYERWEYIFTATFFCFLALIIPTLILIKSEKAKKQAETELTAIFNSSALGITISDLQGKILRTNPAHQLIFGYSLDDLKSMVFSDFTHPDDKKRHQVVYEKMISGEISHFNMRKRFIHKEGHIVWANVTVSLIKNDDQKPMFILGMVEDISSHIQAENRLQESERRFRELSEMLPEALFETDLDMNLTYANRQAFSLFGYTTQDFEKGLNGLDLIEPKERERARKNLKKRLLGENRGSSEYIALKKDGSSFPILLHTNPIIQEGDAKGFRGIVIDITDRKKIEEDLIQSEERFRLAFNTSPEAVNINKMDGTYVEINEGFTSLTGYTKEDVIGKSSSDIKIWDIPEDRQQLIEGLQKNGKVINLESRFLMKDGSYKVALMSANIITLQGEPHILSITRDITEKKKAEEEKERLEEQLRQSQKMEAVGTMAGGIAHDFNNILAIILGNLGLVIDDLTPDNPMRSDLEEALKASHRAKDLVSQILTFSRKEQKKLISLRPQALIEETLKLLRSTTPATVSITQNISRDCGRIMADPTSLHQILMNLFTNAVHSMDEKGEVTVSLQEVNLGSDELDQLPAMAQFFSIKTPGTYAKLSVTDSGTGMDEKTVERIFDPFYTTKDVGKGTGMGLSLVHGIVESHGGFIDVDSEPGRGSTFHVFFPVTDEEEPIEAETTPLQTGTERILFIDDEEGLLVLGKRILDKFGYEVTAEINSVKALEIFKSDPDQFDLIITDQAMPNMSGLEFVAEIVKVRPDMPVLLCTGYSSKVTRENAAEKGISGFITKPYTKKILAEAIRKVLNGKV